MSLPHMSVSTIDSPEFINLQPLDINPMMSKCEIKVFYLGENRNQSFISKEIALEMAKTLRGAPIVGYYKSEKDDFSDHGQRITLDGEEVRFECMTKPYGFVSPDAKVWFKTFTETDDFGNEITREYMMTTGYLWTGQYPEAQSVIDEGKPQSMELEETEGHWSKNSKNGLDFFIINDAIISKLCILGDDIEPCFEGASITKQNFTLDDNFKKSLFQMMEELKFALKGDTAVEDNKEEVIEETKVEEEPIVEDSSAEEVADTSITEEAQVESTEFAKDPKEDDKQDDSKSAPAEDNKDSDNEEKSEDKKDDEDKKQKCSLHTDDEYSALEADYNELKNKYSLLQSENEELKKYKADNEKAKKDAVIESFSKTLSESDMRGILEHEDEYTAEILDEKLSALSFRLGKMKSENISKNENNQEDREAQTFVVGTSSSQHLSDWVSEVMRNQSHNLF